MTSPDEGSPTPLPPAIATAFAAVAFLALTICGLGLASLVLDRDVVAIPGGGSVPGIVGMLLSLAVFGGILAFALRSQHPSYWSAPVIAIAVWLAYGTGLLFGALLQATGPAAAAAGALQSLVSWFGVVVAVSAIACAWGGVALVRTRAHRPRWRWERDEEE